MKTKPIMWKAIIVSTLLTCFIDGAASKCTAYLHSKDRPKLYWQAHHQSLPLLSEIDKTLWSFEMPSIPFERKSVSLKVEETLDSNAIGEYLCIMDKKEVRLCTKKENNKWIRSFEFVNKSWNEFQLKSMESGAFESLLQGEEYEADMTTQYKLDLVHDSVKERTFWVAEIVEGCFGMFRPNTTPAPTTSTSTTTATTTTTTSTTTTSTSTTTTEESTTTESLTTTEMPTTTDPLTTEILTTSSSTTTPTSTTVTSTSSSTRITCIFDASGVRNESHCFDASQKSSAVSKIIKNKLNELEDRVTSLNTNVTIITEKNKDLGKVKVAEQMLEFAETIEHFGLKIAQTLAPNKSITVKTSDINMAIRNQKLPFSYPENSSNYIRIEPADGVEDEQQVVGILFENFHEYMLEVTLTLKNAPKQKEYKINSRLITGVVGSSAVVRKAIIVLEHLEEVDPMETQCAFWDTSRHFWSTNGCQKLVSLRNQTTCECSHLTNFAILTAYRYYEVSSLHQNILNTMSFVCCCISISFLLIGIILFILLLTGERKHTRHVIHLNLMVTLFIAQVIFITGANATKNATACKGIAFLLHYFFLSSFGWMLVEGLYLYFAVIKVFSDGKIYLRWYMVLAWGLPAIIVIITGSINYRWYGTDQHCWLSGEGYAIWGFLAPILCIILINSVILFLVIRQIVQLAKRGGVLDDVKIGLRSSIILLPILGTTWIFGILSFNTHTIVFQYIFNITNSLQGFLITLFHCFLNSEVRNALRRKTEIWTHTIALGRHFSSTNKTRSSHYDTSISISSARKRSIVALMGN